jgi:hypothetical protein
LDYWRNRRIGTPALLAAGLVIGTYVQGFVAYVSDSLETHRHMIGAFVLYRFAALVGLYAIVDIIRSPTRESGVVSWIGRRKEPAPCAVPRDAANQELRTLDAYPSASVQGPTQRRSTASPTTHCEPRSNFRRPHGPGVGASISVPGTLWADLRRMVASKRVQRGRISS